MHSSVVHVQLSVHQDLLHGDGQFFKAHFASYSGDSKIITCAEFMRFLEAEQVIRETSILTLGASIYDIRKIFGILDPPPPPPLVRKFTQPPLLSSSTMSAFGLTPPQCGRHKWKPP